jgi:Type I phosphodiesterase / nucleotide pyrophosphatase
MTWLLLRIVDLFNALAAWYYQRKYGAAARQLGRGPYEEADGRRGFIILEFDGLAYDYLQQAVEQGCMPYLAHLVQGRKLRLARWRCGLPSTTPAAQAGILYGNNWDIPGFRWYDKETHSAVTCNLPGSVRAIQERISAGRAGLLRGGSSYTNLFDGDARLALFTMAALGRDCLFENVRGVGFLILFGLDPWRSLKVIALSLWTWLVYVAKRLAALVRPGTPHFTFLGPLLEIASNIIFREVTTFSVMVDIYRGMPAIYAAYTGYDEIAHHFGAAGKEAFRALRGLDKQIRQIDRMRQLYRRRDYDLYVLSDHGMTPSVPFRRAYGQTLQQFIAAHTGQEVQGIEGAGGTEGLPEARVRFLLGEVQALEARPHRTLPARLLRATRQQLEERLLAEALAAEWDLSRRDDMVVQSSGSLSHVYWNITPRPMDLSEVVLLYPTLLEALVQHAGIGLVVGREGEDVVIASRAGTLWIGPSGRRLEGDDPLAGLLDGDWAAEQVARLARFPHAGDLILLGAWDGEQVVSFEEQVASHGGLGGPQSWPFLAFPAGERLLVHGIDNAEEVYTRLVGVYGGYG